MEFKKFKDLYTEVKEKVAKNINEKFSTEILNIVNEEGNTFLHHAAAFGDLDVVRNLVENGADLNAKNNCGRTPIFHAVFANPEVVEFLVSQKDIDLNVKDRKQITVLHEAVINGNGINEKNSLKILLDSNKIVDLEPKAKFQCIVPNCSIFIECELTPLQRAENLFPDNANILRKKIEEVKNKFSSVQQQKPIVFPNVVYNDKKYESQIKLVDVGKKTEIIDGCEYLKIGTNTGKLDILRRKSKRKNSSQISSNSVTKKYNSSFTSKLSKNKTNTNITTI